MSKFDYDEDDMAGIVVIKDGKEIPLKNTQPTNQGE